MATAANEKLGELHTVRDTVESIWVAIVVAFVLRAFLLEAFVIPTGSMAPGLVGEHWDLTCPSCGYAYARGKPRTVGQVLTRGERYKPHAAVCPNCGALYSDHGADVYLNSGDRVLVLKFPYIFRDPQPWEVPVFRNPQDNRQNYIKRLIGVPGEWIQIVHGDVFYAPSEDGPWRIRRKPIEAQQVMWQVVFDNDYRPSAERLAEDDCPRWTVPFESDRWDLTGQAGRRFAFRGSTKPEELLFRVPSNTRDKFFPHYGYNAPGDENQVIIPSSDVCTDLRIEAMFQPAQADSRLGLQLTSFEHRFRAEVAGDGTVALLHTADEGPPIQWAGGPVHVEGIRLGKPCHVALTHADFRVRVWINGRIVLESSEQEYSPDMEDLKRRMRDAPNFPIPTPQIKIIGQGGPFDIWRVRLMRDVYYTSPTLPELDPGPAGDFARHQKLAVRQNSPGWATMDNPIHLRKHPDNRDLDEFFVLGDNSPASLDGRQWTRAAPTLRLYEDDDKTKPLYQLGTVPRYAMTGRAFFVYWPSGFRIPALPGLPIIPNVGKMRFIR